MCLQAFSAFGVFLMKQFYEGVPTELYTLSLHDALPILMPVDATPCTKYFCMESNTISTGISATTEAAMIRPYSAEYW